MARRNTMIERVADFAQTPMVPNFLRLHGGGSVSVGEVSDSVLRAVARRWRDDLLANARRKRAAALTPSATPEARDAYSLEAK